MAETSTAPTANSQTPLLVPSSLSPILNVSWAGETEGDGAPPKTGTIFSSAMNLAACALGASMLSLPYTMMISGPLVALEFLVIFAIMAFFAAQAVVNAGLRSKKSSYAAIVTHYFGQTQGFVAEILLSVALLVAAISYIVGLVDILPDLLPFVACLSRNALILGILLLLFPMTLISSLAAFGAASTFAAAGCYIQALALIVNLAVQNDWKVPSESVWVGINPFGLLYSQPMICFVYAFHYVLTDTLSELENPTRMRMTMVNLTTVLIMIGCYLPVAIAGYLAFSGENIEDNLLAQLPTGPVSIIAKLSIAALLLITYSLFIIPLRRKLEEASGGLTTSMKDPKRVGIATILMLVVATISVALPNLGLANALAGGCIALVMFFFPGRLMLQSQLDLPLEQRDPLRIGIGGIFVFFGSLICFMGLFGPVLIDPSMFTTAN